MWCTTLYWGKPAVRNFRGDDGNVGIIRSPVRAIVLLDRKGAVSIRLDNASTTPDSETLSIRGNGASSE
jgi:hypothetical protein